MSLDGLDKTILDIKKQNPGWGRHKIHKELKACGLDVSLTTIQRRLKKLGKANEPTRTKFNILDDIASKFSESELRAIAQSGSRRTIPKGRIEWADDSFKVLLLSDSHIGHSRFIEELWDSAAEVAVDECVDWCYHAGDILEGMSGRDGHIYELSQIGFEQQFSKAKELIGGFPVQVRGITGNHDLWYMGKADIGLNVGERLEESLPGQYIHLGNEEAVDRVGSVDVMLWHGRDGSSYATSYRTQKFVESLPGGQKPHVLFSGHAHKSIFHQCRNVQVFESGTLCDQTGFMRGKKLEAHVGFWVVEIFQNARGLERIKQEWRPFFGY